VTVYIPPEVKKTMEHADEETRQKIIHSAAGAQAAIEAEEQAKKPEEK